MSIDTTQLIQAAQHYGTPLWLYHAEKIQQQIARLRRFDVIRYAQKACSNTHILKLMYEQGLAIDAVSAGELQRSLHAGFIPNKPLDSIVFTADIIDWQTLALVCQHQITVNAGSLDMLQRIGEHAPRKHRIWLRINPGFGDGHHDKTNTGGAHSKHGIWLTEIAEAFALIQRYSLHLVGIHMHIGSGVNYQHLALVCDAMVEIIKNSKQNHPHLDIEAISAGGGLSIPYRISDPELDTDHYFDLWDQARKKIEGFFGHTIRLEIEPGRFLVAQAGVLISTVHALKNTPAHRFILVDAGFNDLIRPSFYGSYHKISVLGIRNQESGVGCRARGLVYGNTQRMQAHADDAPRIRKAMNTDHFIVAGPLCESGDIFTLNYPSSQRTMISGRLLSEPQLGDFIVIHDAGAYGASMSSNYNSRPLAAEVLLENQQLRLIRRRQTIEELIQLEYC